MQNNRPVLILSIFCSLVMILDSVLVTLYTLPLDELLPSLNLALFSIFLLFFFFSNFIFLQYSRQAYLTPYVKSRRFLGLIYNLTLINQCILSISLTLIAVQLTVVGYYDVTIRNIVIYISHVSAISYLLILVYQFVRWFTINRNFVVLAYAVGFSTFALNITISAIYLIDDSSYHDPTPRLRPIGNQIGDYSNYGSDLLSILIITYTYLSFLSFVCVWIPSVMLLKTYSQRLGKIKYWVLVALPLAYFFLPTLLQETGLYYELLLEYGTQFSLIFYVIFSPYRQIGGLLFGIVFWLTASRISRPNLKALLQIAGIGMILLFGSTVLHGLAFIVAPPFGLITVSFVGLASFLLLSGIYLSATQLSRDTTVRKELYKITEEQLGLLGRISIAEVNRTLEEKVKKILLKSEAMEKEEGPSLEAEVDESDYKRFIEDAMNELKAVREKRNQSEFN
jgi:hypothetical protein